MIARETWVAQAAVQSLIDEASLTPKPALVDRRGNGAHRDLSLALLVTSAYALRDAFERIAALCAHATAGQTLREQLGAVGRDGERSMLLATGGVNTHRGALWSLGLMVAGYALTDGGDSEAIAACAGVLAALPDRLGRSYASNGARVRADFGVRGARGEADAGFPHVMRVALPILRAARDATPDCSIEQIDALLSIMTTLEDTCLLHRGGMHALRTAQEGARAVLAAGGFATPRGERAFWKLDATLLALNASPGGAADLLAAAMFLDRHERRTCE